MFDPCSSSASGAAAPVVFAIAHLLATVCSLPYWVVRIICRESARASKPTRTPMITVTLATGLTLPKETQSLRPHFEDVQAHYDLSDDFFQLFLDPTRTYSCAYFERDDMTLEEAQIAKIDLALGKLGLQPGMTLLDVGCGWGAAMQRALEKYDVNVVGLTLSKNQKAHVEQLFDGSDSPRSKRVLLRGLGAVPRARGPDRGDRRVRAFRLRPLRRFLQEGLRLLPADGKMLLHTIVRSASGERGRKTPMTMRLARFVKFIMDEIFPGGQLPSVALVEEHAAKAGFTVSRIQRLQPHYARTLDTWAAALEAHKDEAIAI